MTQKECTQMSVSRRKILRAAAGAPLLAGAGLLPAGGFAQEAGVERIALGRLPARRGGAAPPPLSAEETAAVEQALGKKGSMVADQGVFTVPLPRNDLKMRIQGEPVPIPFGFGGWVAFKKADDGKTVLMSDTVLLQEEVNPVISTAQENGIEVTAIHNHFFFEEPRVFYMHVHGMGETGQLAQSYAAAIRPSKLHPANQPTPGAPPARTATDLFDTAELARIAGHEGQVNGPVYKITVGRPDLHVMAMGAEITAAVGLNSWAAFAGDREQARIAGDMAMLEPEVNPVIRALRAHQLNVVACHHHMIGERPRIIFLHYYGTGRATDLAQGFRAALDELGRHGTGPLHVHEGGERKE
jgi:hypothetical protein